MYAVFYVHRNCYSKGDNICSHHRVCYVAMTMVMLEYMCVQIVMIAHTQCFMLIVNG